MILFGVASLETIPIQMTPDIDKPILQVRVSWPGASPKCGAGSRSSARARIDWTFGRTECSKRQPSWPGSGYFDLWRRSGYGCSFSKASRSIGPSLWSASDAKQPEVRTSNSDDSPIARMALVAQDGVEIDIDTLGQFVDTVILEPLSRISGIAEVTSRGGVAREIRLHLISIVLLNLDCRLLK